jgi:hypothetical protein
LTEVLRGSCPMEKGRLTARQPRGHLSLALRSGNLDGRCVRAVLRPDGKQHCLQQQQQRQLQCRARRAWQSPSQPVAVSQPMAPAQGCSGSSSSIWGEEGTVQASQCCCRAAGGAFPKRRNGQQPPGACSDGERGQEQDGRDGHEQRRFVLSLAGRRRVCSAVQLAANAPAPLLSFKGAAVVGHDPSAKQ